jgi:hypothetical protein
MSPFNSYGTDLKHEDGGNHFFVIITVEMAVV